MKETSILRTQASTRTTTYTDDNGMNVKDYDIPGTYGADNYFEQDYSYPTGQPPGYDKVRRPESPWQTYYLKGHENKLDPSMNSIICANSELNHRMDWGHMRRTRSLHTIASSTRLCSS